MVVTKKVLMSDKNILLGFASGSITTEIEFQSRIEFLREIGCTALELHLESLDIEKLIKNKTLINIIREFSYLSFHARKEDIDDSFRNIKKLMKILPIQNVIVHPVDIDDLEIVSNTKFPILIENMDKRKNDAQSVFQMKKWLKLLPNTQIVFDINHVFTLDKTMKLADDFWETFFEQIKEIHISGFIDWKLLHEPMTTSNCQNLIRYIRNKRLPVIIETFTAELSHKVLKQEFEFIKNYLLS